MPATASFVSDVLSPPSSTGETFFSFGREGGVCLHCGCACQSPGPAGPGRAAGTTLPSRSKTPASDGCPRGDQGREGGAYGAKKDNASHSSPEEGVAAGAVPGRCPLAGDSPTHPLCRTCPAAPDASQQADRIAAVRETAVLAMHSAIDALDNVDAILARLDRLRQPTAHLVLHVREQGSDSLDGRSEDTAKQTLAGALAALQRYDSCGTATTLRVGPGVFTAPETVFSRTTTQGHPCVVLQGAGRDATRLQCAAGAVCLRVRGAQLVVRDCTLAGGLDVADLAVCELTGRVRLRAASADAALLECGTGAVLRIAGELLAQGDCRALVRAAAGGIVQVRGTCRFEDAPRYAEAVCHARDGMIFWDPDCAAQGEVRARAILETGAGRVLWGTQTGGAVTPGH